LVFSRPILGTNRYKNSAVHEHARNAAGRNQVGSHQRLAGGRSLELDGHSETKRPVQQDRERLGGTVPRQTDTGLFRFLFSITHEGVLEWLTSTEGTTGKTG
jgi:hypothetical protein